MEVDLLLAEWLKYADFMSPDIVEPKFVNEIPSLCIEKGKRREAGPVPEIKLRVNWHHW